MLLGLPGALAEATWTDPARRRPGTKRQDGNHERKTIAMTAPATPAPQVWPSLRARDARALIKFLVDAFGFEETVVYGEGDRVDHAQLDWPPGGGIMLGAEPARAWAGL